MIMDDVKRRIHNMWPHLNERQRRMLAASEAQSIGYGGITAVSEICGLSRVTVTKGVKELDLLPLEGNRIRMPGSGRLSLIAIDPDLAIDLEDILESTTRGDPESPLRRTCLSTRAIAKVLNEKQHSISFRTVDTLVNKLRLFVDLRSS